ncbi:MAG: metal-sensing transcriptional repressor [Xanthobacteraceae bacterium]|jgi:DNA-binding FrmR family transcriptional regulator
MPQQNHPHQSHTKIIRRLKRAEGHLRIIIKMIEEGHPCVDLAQQLQAVENAIDNAKKALIHDHIDHCVDRSIKAPGPKNRALLKEFRAITKYL